MSLLGSLSIIIPDCRQLDILYCTPTLSSGLVNLRRYSKQKALLSYFTTGTLKIVITMQYVVYLYCNVSVFPC